MSKQCIAGTPTREMFENEIKLCLGNYLSYDLTYNGPTAILLFNQ